MSRLLLVTVLFLLGFVKPLRAQDAPLWLLIAQSDVVATGELVFDCLPPERAYVLLPLRSTHALKGEVDGGTAIRWFSATDSYAPSSTQLCELAGREVVVFGQWAEGGLYFAGYSPAAVRPSSPALLAAVSAEVDRQERVLASWRIETDVPHYAEVQAVLDEIAALPPASRGERRSVAARQQALFDRLIALGPEGVPAIIMLMDDRRALPDRSISLINRYPGAFEGARHYAPKVVADALDAILNDITGQTFGSITNGGTEQDRRRVVDGWRIYLDHLRRSDAQ